jgi:SAM-dependent methyltransferase
MKPEDVERLFDRDYAGSYEEKFLDSTITAADTRYEVDLLRSFLTPTTRWLDVGCGTGYFLRRFPGVDRVGLDLSAGMLERARVGNADVELRRHDFRTPIHEWTDRFGLVSCMWYAYCYVDTVAELSQLIGNLAAWTAPSGRCFVPLADPDLLTRQKIPYRQDTGHAGEMSITGILWSFVEEGGAKAHRHLVSPNLEFMREQFAEFFESVEIVLYPMVNPVVGRRPALVATGKRTGANPRDRDATRRAM